MKSFCLYCFAALTAGVVLVSHGVTDETADPFGDTFDAEDVSEALVEVPAPRSDVEELRARYLEAAKQRAEMMDEDALRDAVETEEKSVAELRAHQALKKVEQELERIGDEYSDTTAGQHAVVVFNQLQDLNRNGRARPRDGYSDRHFDDDRRFDGDDTDFLERRRLDPRKDDAFGDAPDVEVIPDQDRETPFRPSGSSER